MILELGRDLLLGTLLADLGLLLLEKLLTGFLAVGVLHELVLSHQLMYFLLLLLELKCGRNKPVLFHRRNEQLVRGD